MSRGHVLEGLRQAVRFDWSQVLLREATRLVPAVILTLAAGLWFGDPTQSAVATSGAFVVGFGAFQQFTGAPTAPMVFAAIGMTVSIFVGTLVGQSTPALIVAVLLYGCGVGLLPSIGMGAFWIGQQCAVFLLIAGAYSGGAGEALTRAALVLAGAGTQLACYALIRFLMEGRLARPAWSATLFEARQALAGLGAQLRHRTPLFSFALRFAIALVVAVATERALAIPHGYWVAMTTLLLLRPDFQDTYTRSLGRLGGTLLGAALATGFAHVAVPGPVVLAALTALFAFFSYACLRLNYGVFSFFLTGYVILLLTLAGLAEREVASERIESTLIGGVFALAAHIAFYRWRRGFVRRRNQAATAQTRRD
jgi:uncharacterized membrane protein YccC